MERVTLIRGAIGVARQIESDACVAVQRGQAGTTVFGPYQQRGAGAYTVRFKLGLADDVPPLGDSICARIDVVTNDGATLIVERFVLFSELRDELDGFELAFTLGEPRCIEYRVISTGQVALNVCEVVEIASASHRSRARCSRGSRERAWENEREFLDGYLRNISGVIHVGANLGQERRYYWLIGVDVLWVEPIREVYEKMIDNISLYPRQRGVNALLGARDGEEVTLGIANNNGASSSMLPLDEHAVLFPDIEIVEQRKLTTITLDTMISRYDIQLDDYQALTLDTEGAEMMILQGAGDLLRHFDYVKCEVADFPARTGTPSTKDLDNLLTGLGFRQLARRSFGMGPGDVGTFWDIVWKRSVPGEPLHEPNYTLPLIMNPTEVLAVEKCE